MPSEERYRQGLGWEDEPPTGPRAWVGRTIHQRANGLLPLESFRDVIAFQIVAARKAQERWVERSHFLRQVDPVPMRPIMKRGRKQRYNFKPDCCRRRDSKLEMVVPTNRRLAGLERERILLPIAGQPCHFRATC